MLKKLKGYNYLFLMVISFFLLTLVSYLTSINLCPIKLIFGIPCPGCGMTRALLALLHLQFGKAFYYHPLWPLVVLGAPILIYFFFKNNPIFNNKAIMYPLLAIFMITYILRFILQYNEGAMQLEVPIVIKIFQNLFKF